VSAASTSGSCSESAGVVMCDIGLLPLNTSATVTIVATANASGAATNTATARLGIADPNLANNTAVVVTTAGALADLALTQSAAPNPAFVSNNLTYTLTITNRGPSPAPGVIVSNVLPANV